MSEDKILDTIQQIEQDIHYYKNFSFDGIVVKFQRDLDLINDLRKTIKITNEMRDDNANV